MIRQGVHILFFLLVLFQFMWTWTVAVSTQQQSISTTPIPPDADVKNGNNKKYRQFLHISDFHYDPHYDQNKSCDMRKNEAKPGRFGDYRCDSPKILIQSAVNYMKQLFPKPDFILWTG